MKKESRLLKHYGKAGETKTPKLIYKYVKLSNLMITYKPET